jgi:uncharacterized surface protein with fasciclin (FAS1) repeats
MRLLKLLFAGAIALSLVACHGDDDPKPVPAPTKNIVETATAAGGFTTLLAAAQAADPAVVATLTGPGPVTLFAPTDAAFNALLTELGLTANQLLANQALLTTVLTYHVVPRKVLKKDIPVGKAITSAQGGIFKVDNNPSNQLQVFDGRNRASTITSTDILATNGVIHVIDKVLLPADKNIVQTAQALPDFSILVEAVIAADLATTLSGAGPFTVFAPTNTAFAAALTELGVTKDALFADKALLTKILTYHVVPSRVLKAEIPFGTAVATVQGETLIIDNTATITDQRARTSKIVITDVLTSNGVIHAIDKLILPKP